MNATPFRVAPPEFVGAPWLEWAERSWHVPLCACLAYALMIEVGPGVAAGMIRSPSWLPHVLFGWNFALCAFSVYGAGVLVPFLARAGPDVCTPLGPESTDGTVGYALSLFTLSKIVELGDTVFIILRQRPVSWLHSIHHATVLPLTWHLYVAKASTGPLFAGLNYVAHTFTYGFFALTQVPRVRKAAIRNGVWVTVVQMVQFVFGAAACVWALVANALGHECGTAPSSAGLALGMYFLYFGLFASMTKERTARVTGGAKEA